MRIVSESWPLARDFKISRSTMSVAKPLVVELRAGSFLGRGECEAHESDAAVIAAALEELESLRAQIEHPDFSRTALQQLLRPCPIRNALDCAIWDLQAKRSKIPVWQLARLDAPGPLLTVQTISVDEPAVMERDAARLRDMPILKIKLKGDGDLERLQAVRRAAPQPRLIVDANEAWTFEQLQCFAPRCRELGVELIEQPLPRGCDAQLLDYRSPVPLCADESCHDVTTLADVLGKYQFINIKLDKTGGLTEAIKLLRQASASGLRIMVGCMVGTSLAMAPATLLARYAEFVDLDGPLLLRTDREPGLVIRDGVIEPPAPELWG